ncbi:MAG: HD domain-containing protein [Lachnospiraceae bacterium]|nr:HD domain-containing protein [Lachnospiraceae bacterium]
MSVTTFAAIDVGSYEVEMVIYEISTRGIKQIDHVRHIIALGRDTYNMKAISYDLVDELCEVLYDFVSVMKTYQVSQYRAIATSAVREAVNSVNIIDRIKMRTGLKVEILSNSEQRLIMYEAVAAKKEGFGKLIEKGVAMADVGSGSSQVSLFDNGSLITTQNVQLGALRVNEIVDSFAKGASSSLAIMEEYMDTEIDVLKNLFIKERKIECLIAVGDNINWFINRIGAEKSKEYYNRDEFLDVYHKLYLMGDFRERYGLSVEQAAVIIPSMMIYKKILDVTGAQTMWIPGVRLCDGMAAEYALKEKKIEVFEHDFTADIVAAARNISKRYSWNKEHVKFVEKNAMAIFDATKKLHGLGKREKLLLQIACILHDCGQYISMLKPAECSYNLVMSTEIIGLSHLEREMVANIVKYTTIDWEAGVGLKEAFNDETILTVSKLTAITKVSNALDRGHKQKFKDTKYVVKERELQIITNTYEDITLEKGSVSNRRTLFEEVYGCKPVIIQKRK